VANPLTAYAGPKFVSAFLQAGIKYYTFHVPGDWWLGPGRYDFSGVDAFIQDYVRRIPGASFMPRIDFSRQGFPWWGDLHPGEMDLLLNAETSQPLDPTRPNPAALPYLGHEVNLAGLNLHSFHSQVWRQEAGEAIASLVRHCEAMPYAAQIWAWHLCNGLFCEWFHWHEYSFGALSDYSPAAQADFRRWLKLTYHDDPALLSKAWGRPLDFDQISIPAPRERLQPAHGEFYDPVLDRSTIDYSLCFSEATVDCILAVCQAVKRALPAPKPVCVFYGYQFSNMPRPTLNAHYAVEKLLASDAVDMIASPHAYSNRGHGGYHAPQALAESIRRAGKIHLDEIDCKTVWTPASVTWKTHISQPATVAETVEMMKKDAAYALASDTAYWWMDLTDQGWFDDPAAVEPMQRLRLAEERLASLDTRSASEVAFVVSQRSMHFMAPHEGLHNMTLKVFRNWHLSRLGAPFDTLLVDELERPDLPEYKLYIFANLFYLSGTQRSLLHRVLQKPGKTALWVYAPGYQDDTSASIENMHELTGIHFGLENIQAELDVGITDHSHPITLALPTAFQYGTGINRQQYLQPPKIQYLPQTVISPQFYADDSDVQVLGLSLAARKPGLVVTEYDGYRSIYSAAPVLSWRLLQGIARYAGVHLYVQNGDMLWANRSFLALYSQSAGSRRLRFPGPRNLEDAYSGQRLAQSVTGIDLEMGLYETRLLMMQHPEARSHG
jgi:hypothetical protein